MAEETRSALGRQHHWDRAQTLKLVFGAFAIRLLGGLLSGQLFNPDVLEYEAMARHLLAGEGLYYEHLGTRYYAFVPPVYPLFIALVFALTAGSEQILLIAQCLLGALICLEVRALAMRLAGRKDIAVLAGWLVALHPGLVLYATKPHPLTTDVLAYLGVLLAWLWLAERRTFRIAVIAGVVSGIALLSRGTIAFFLPLAAGWLVFLMRKEWFRAIRLVIVVAGISATFLGAWLARNAFQLDAFPVYQTTRGEVLWRGNNPVASGSAFRPDGRTVLEAAPDTFIAGLEGKDELQQNEYFLTAAAAFMSENPLQAARLYLGKLFSFWWFSPQAGFLYPLHYLLLYGAYYLAAVLLALGGGWSVRRQASGRALVLLAGFVLVIALSQSLYYVEGRHRWTVEPLILIFTAAGMVNVGNRFSPGRPTA